MADSLRQLIGHPQNFERSRLETVTEKSCGENLPSRLIECRRIQKYWIMYLCGWHVVNGRRIGQILTTTRKRGHFNTMRLQWWRVRRWLTMFMHKRRVTPIRIRCGTLRDNCEVETFVSNAGAQLQTSNEHDVETCRATTRVGNIATAVHGQKTATYTLSAAPQQATKSRNNFLEQTQDTGDKRVSSHALTGPQSVCGHETLRMASYITNTVLL